MDSFKEVLSSLPVLALEFVYRAETPIQLHQYPGTSFRGILGENLKRNVCNSPELECKHCFFNTQCVYPFLYESPSWLNLPLLSENRQFQNQSHVLHPIVLNYFGDKKIAKEQQFKLNITLIGQRAIKAKDDVKRALEAFDLNGKSPGRAQLISVNAVFSDEHGLARCINASDVPPTPESVRLTFDTPLKMKFSGEYISEHTLSSMAFLSGLQRRIEQLYLLHGNINSKQPNISPSFKTLNAITFTPIHSMNVKWNRYSSKQKKIIPMKGISGEYLIAGEDLKKLWPWLWLGQFLQLGKSTLMGLGKYSLDVIDDKSIVIGEGVELETEKLNVIAD